jgi:ABC-type lipoprotein release transport system permease subunit
MNLPFLTALNDLKNLTTFIAEIGILLGVITPVLILIVKIINGQKCQLRSEMLQIYYKNKNTKQIHQYEFENFMLLYEAYKALKGNSFIDTIHNEVKKWDIIM